MLTNQAGQKLHFQQTDLVRSASEIRWKILVLGSTEHDGVNCELQPRVIVAERVDLPIDYDWGVRLRECDHVRSGKRGYVLDQGGVKRPLSRDEYRRLQGGANRVHPVEIRERLLHLPPSL